MQRAPPHTIHLAAVSSAAVFMTTPLAHHIAARSSRLHGSLCPLRALHCWKAWISPGQCFAAICTRVWMTFGAATVAQSSNAFVSRSQLGPAVWQACRASACALQNAIVVSSCRQQTGLDSTDVWLQKSRAINSSGARTHLPGLWYQSRLVIFKRHEQNDAHSGVDTRTLSRSQCS